MLATTRAPSLRKPVPLFLLMHYNPGMIEKRGTGVFPGVVIGKAAVFRHTVLDSVEHLLADDTEHELAVFEGVHARLWKKYGQSI